MERLRARRRRRIRLGLAFGGLAAVAAVVAALLVSGGEGGAGPEQHVTFAGLPGTMRISAKLIPNAFGTEVHMYVKGVSSGTLCRVYLRSRDGRRLSAGTFRYRWGDEDYPVLNSALDLSKTRAVEIDVGMRTFVAALTPRSPAPGAGRPGTSPPTPSAGRS